MSEHRAAGSAASKAGGTIFVWRIGDGPGRIARRTQDPTELQTASPRRRCGGLRGGGSNPSRGPAPAARDRGARLRLVRARWSWLRSGSTKPRRSRLAGFLRSRRARPDALGVARSAFDNRRVSASASRRCNRWGAGQCCDPAGPKCHESGTGSVSGVARARPPAARRVATPPGSAHPAAREPGDDFAGVCPFFPFAFL